METSLEPRQFTLLLFMAFAGCALALAVIGVYAVISQDTSERWWEFGVRIALGAQAKDVIGRVMRQGVASAGASVLIGVAGAAVLRTALRGMLFSVAPLDVVTFGVVGGVMFTTAMLACYVPARRATGVDPLAAVRAT